MSKRNAHVSNVEELEQIVTDSISAMENEKEFEQFKEMEKVSQVQDHTENNRLYGILKDIERHILSVDKDVLAVKKQNHSLIIHAITELHFIRKHQTKFVFITMGVIFLAGIIVGTQDESWLPHLSEILRILNFGSKAG